MRCPHMQKDDPENAICDDCWNEEYDKQAQNFKKLEGGQNGN